MTFGRPASIPDHYVQVSLPQHLVCPAPDSNPSPWSSSENSTLFFNASMYVFCTCLLSCLSRRSSFVALILIRG